MADIKVKDVADKSVKGIDRVANLATKTKDTVLDVKTKAENVNTDNSTLDYGSEKISSTSRSTEAIVAKGAINTFNREGKKALFKTKNNFKSAKIKVKQFNKLRKQKAHIKAIGKSAKVNIKVPTKALKNTTKATYKTVRNSQKSLMVARASAKKATMAVKAAIKATMAALKGIIAGTKALIALLIAGGWVAIVVIIILFMAMLLFGSIFGIFFSSDKSVGGTPMSIVVEELNLELSNKIMDIKEKELCDDYTITSTRAEWKEILTIYVAKITGGKEDMEVITLDDNKISQLRTVFWDMNEITHTTKTEKVSEQPGTTQKICDITISGKTATQMETVYMFTWQQKEQVKELLKPEYDDLWIAVLSGANIGADEMFLKQYFSVPFQEGVSFVVTSGFGLRPDPFDKSKTTNHSGIDVVPMGSSKVTVPADGIVKSVKYESCGGNIVVIEHDFSGTKFRSTYVHLKDGSIVVKDGQDVYVGNVIADYGNTGTCTTGPHLHFTIEKLNSNGKWEYVNPVLIFR